MKIAIVALNGSPLIDSRESRQIGGLETFAWSLCQALAKDRSHSVMFLVRSGRPRSATTLHGVQVSAIHEPLRDVRQSVSKSMEIDPKVGRFRIKRWNPNLLWQFPALGVGKLLFKPYSEQGAIEKSLQEFSPQILVALGVNETSRQLGEIGRRCGIPVLLWIQSNADLEPKLYATEDYQDKYGVTSAVAQACLTYCRSLIFQSQAQQKQFQSLEPTLRRQRSEPFQVNLIPNPVDANRFSLGAAHSLRQGVLWVGRADRFHKRPLLAIEIAKLCPDVPFQFVLNAGEADVRRQVEKELPSNVQLIDFVPNESMPERMRESRLFLSTGSPEFEGFPNVLLEAAASGTPIVSLEDFDDFLARSGGGKAHGGDVHQASETLKRWYESENEWSSRSADGCQYVEKFHSLDAISAEFTRLAKKTISTTR